MVKIFKMCLTILGHYGLKGYINNNKQRKPVTTKQNGNIPGKLKTEETKIYHDLSSKLNLFSTNDPLLYPLKTFGFLMFSGGRTLVENGLMHVNLNLLSYVIFSMELARFFSIS